MTAEDYTTENPEEPTATAICAAFQDTSLMPVMMTNWDASWAIHTLSFETRQQWCLVVDQNKVDLARTGCQ